MRRIGLLTLMICSAFAVTTAPAASFRLSDIPLAGQPVPTLLISGEIEAGDWTSFFRMVRRSPPFTAVSLESIGGSLDDGLAIAKYIYERRLDTHVSGPCHSICAVMFLAGAQRFVGPDAVITMHNAYKQIGDWVVADHDANGTVAWFLGHMGYPLKLARMWILTRSDTVAPITPEVNAELGLGITFLD